MSALFTPSASPSLCSSLAVLYDSSEASAVCARALLAMAITVHVGNQVERPARNALRVLVPLFTCLFFLLYITGTFSVFSRVQEIVQAEETSLRSASGIAEFCKDLQKLAQQQYWQVLFFITSLYLTLQTFCVPGTVVLNAAVGAVMGTLSGVPYCTVLGTMGSMCCFLFSRIVGTSLVEAVDARLMRGKGLTKIRSQVSHHRADLFVYLLFLRLTPILPNWLVNLASPVLGVPLHTFAGATLLGIVPQTYLTVRFGSLAHSGGPGEKKRIVTPWDTLLLAVTGVSILVGFRLKKKFAQSRKDGGSGGVAADRFSGITASSGSVCAPPLV
ncbi:SNARE associated Golgi protein [Leishmania donovani]|uniref:SNARE associated Golgi family protein n=1 Tax=Leishmania donovani TaxID=5661 RepID=A0A504XD79_LEIDO|nr:SNARE associated Golgi family protein [Leishmania donovani]CAJ1987084.1 SNARE associated Golgi protein [Leishmania donovani]VDZ42973.1 SNARE_associated_Golgi_protein_putative/Pfam:PF09335 [Leishmania donovani]